MAAHAGTLSSIGSGRWVKVEAVFDGDTFRTTTGEKVRLLGINAPEVTHDDEPGEPFGNDAKNALKSWIQGKAVQLRLDQERKDRYGRTLAQVYNRDGKWINAELVRRGLAHVYTFAPNFRWTPALLAAETRARSRRLGIWGTPRFQLLAAEKIGTAQIGQFRVVQGRIAHPGRWSFTLGRLRVSIPRAYRHWFSGPLQLHAGSRVIVHGTVRAGRQGSLYLALHSPFDLEINPAEEP